MCSGIWGRVEYRPIGSLLFRTWAGTASPTYTVGMATKGSTVLKRNSTTGEFLVDVPRNVREKTGLKEGDSLIMTTTQDGRIIMRPKSGSLRDLRGVTTTRIKANDQVIRDARSRALVSVSGAKRRPASTKLETVSVKKR